MRLSIFTKGGLYRAVDIQLIMSNQFKSYHINSYHVCVTVTFDILHGFRNIISTIRVFFELTNLETRSSQHAATAAFRAACHRIWTNQSS